MIFNEKLQFGKIWPKMAKNGQEYGQYVFLTLGKGQEVYKAILQEKFQLGQI